MIFCSRLSAAARCPAPDITAFKTNEAELPERGCLRSGFKKFSMKTKIYINHNNHETDQKGSNLHIFLHIIFKKSEYLFYINNL